MKIKVFLFPDYIHLDSMKFRSLTLWRILQEQGVELEEKHWNGTLDSLPKGEPVLVRLSSMMLHSQAELVRFCEESGHLLFYEERILCPTPAFTPEEIGEALNNWLKKNKFIQ